MKRRISVLICLLVMLCMAVCAAAEETGLETFEVTHGSRNSRKIAITMDDVNEREWVWKTVALCRQYNIRVTFFPCGMNLKEEDRDQWLDVIASGCEIGSHTYGHLKFHDIDTMGAIRRLGLFQEQLDKVLGVHYETRWFRPPFGRISDESGNIGPMKKAIERYGYDHALKWDVSQTDPDKCFPMVQNGSILLFHARKKDYNCLVELIPRLLDAGFEPVTVSELFNMEPPQLGGELYVFSKDAYR